MSCRGMCQWGDRCTKRMKIAYLEFKVRLFWEELAEILQQLALGKFVRRTIL